MSACAAPFGAAGSPGVPATPRVAGGAMTAVSGDGTRAALPDFSDGSAAVAFGGRPAFSCGVARATTVGTCGSAVRGRSPGALAFSPGRPADGSGDGSKGTFFAPPPPPWLVGVD